MITSFGIIPFCKREGKWQVLLIQHLNGGHWGFPKGRVAEKTESAQDTAARELTEETGLEVQQYLSQEPFTEYYYLSGQKKMVSYFPALVIGVLKCQPEEVLAAKWFDLDEVVGQLSFPEAQRVFKQAEKSLNEHIT